MSVDDIDYLKEKSKLTSFTFLVDSQDRNYIINPHPNEYVIEFDNPFRNVVGFEISDASIPRTMYNVDIYNNKLCLILNESNHDINIDTGTVEGGVNVEIIIEPADYTIQTLISTMNKLLSSYGIYIAPLSNPPELKNKVVFTSSKNFILDMNNSTCRKVFGFSLMQSLNDGYHRVVPSLKYNEDVNRYYHSIQNGEMYQITSSGIIDLIGEKYVVLRCPEIEQHLTHNLSYSKHNLGLAKFRLGLVGYNEQPVYVNPTKIKEFHPIGKFSRFTFRFLTSQGNLYDFKGIEHNITVRINYYEILRETNRITSVINPNYNPNILSYMNSVAEQDNESEEEEELSTDDFYNKFINNETLYQD
jgi:hypothetical protein